MLAFCLQKSGIRSPARAARDWAGGTGQLGQVGQAGRRPQSCPSCKSCLKPLPLLLHVLLISTTNIDRSPIPHSAFSTFSTRFHPLPPPLHFYTSTRPITVRAAGDCRPYQGLGRGARSLGRNVREAFYRPSEFRLCVAIGETGCRSGATASPFRRNRDPVPARLAPVWGGPGGRNGADRPESPDFQEISACFTTDFD